MAADADAEHDWTTVRNWNEERNLPQLSEKIPLPPQARSVLRPARISTTKTRVVKDLIFGLKKFKNPSDFGLGF